MTCSKLNALRDALASGALTHAEAAIVVQRHEKEAQAEAAKRVRSEYDEVRRNLGIKDSDTPEAKQEQELRKAIKDLHKQPIRPFMPKPHPFDLPEPWSPLRPRIMYGLSQTDTLLNSAHHAALAETDNQRIG